MFDLLGVKELSSNTSKMCVIIFKKGWRHVGPCIRRSCSMRSLTVHERVEPEGSDRPSITATGTNESSSRAMDKARQGR